MGTGKSRTTWPRSFSEKGGQDQREARKIWRQWTMFKMFCNYFTGSWHWRKQKSSKFLIRSRQKRPAETYTGDVFSMKELIWLEALFFFFFYRQNGSRRAVVFYLDKGTGFLSYLTWSLSLILWLLPHPNPATVRIVEVVWHIHKIQSCAHIAI